MKERNQPNIPLGVAAATTVYIIYGLNVVFCKDLFSSSLISPTALFTLRTGGACLLFWLLSFFKPLEKVPKRDLGLLFVASALCIIIPQYSTLIGLTMSTPYDASLVSTLKPVITLAIAFLLGRERFRWSLLIGVLLIFTGALFLVINPSGDAFSTTPLGLLILLLNGISFAFYLVLFKEFVSRYSIVTLMKWMFLFAFLVSIPFSVRELPGMAIDFSDGRVVLELIFLIVAATFLTYFLLPVGQRNLTSTQYSLFCYVQCIVAAIAGTVMGVESLDAQKLLASVFFIAGVFVVRRS